MIKIIIYFRMDSSCRTYTHIVVTIILAFIYYQFACLLDMFDVAEPEEGGMEVVDLQNDQNQEAGRSQQLHKQSGCIKLLQADI